MVARHIEVRRGGFELPKLNWSPRAWFVLEGAALTILGLLAFALPWAAGVAAALVFGWLLLLGGVVSLVSVARTRSHGHVGWRLVSALAAVLAGAIVLINPWAGAWGLALWVAVYFLVTGAALGMAAVHLKRAEAPGWGWLIAPAAVDIALAVMALFVAPVAAPVLIGYLVGLDLVFSGVGVLAFAGSRRRDAWI